MTRRTWRILASGVLLTFAGGWLLARRPSSARGMEKGTAPVARAAPAEADTVTLPAFGSPEFEQTFRERSAAWLEARGRDAGSLVALWDVTGDEALLREAAEKYPDQPVVSAALVQHLLWEEAPAAELQRWIGQFIQNTPGNPLGYHYLATLCAREGDDAGAVAALEKALEQTGRPDSYFRDRAMTAREGALAGGASPGDAASLSLAGPLQRRGPVVLGGNMTGFFKERFSSLKAAGDVEQSQAFAELGLKVVTQLSYAKSPGLIDELVAGQPA